MISNLAGNLCLALLSAVAPAARPRLAAVAFSTGGPAVPSPSELAQQDELQAVAGAAALGATRLTGVDAAKLADPRGAAARAAAQRKGLARFKEGRTAFDNLDLGAAIQLFGDAAAAFGKGEVRSFDPYSQALLWQAASRWVNGDHEAGRAEFDELFALSPETALDKSAFPPDLLEEAGRARADALALPRAPLEVKSSPPALIWIDGRLAGAAPLVVQALPGRHLVAASAPGYAFATARPEGGPVQLQLRPVADAAWFGKARARLAAAWGSPARDLAVRALLDRLGVDELLVLAVEGGETPSLVAARFAKDGHVLAFERQPLAPSASAREVAGPLLERALAADLPRGSGGRPIVGTGLPRSGGLSLDPHSVALGVGGLGAALIVVGTVFGIAAAGARGALGATSQLQTQQSQRLASAGARDAVFSDVFDIVGLVAVGGAAAAWYWPELTHSKKVAVSPVSWRLSPEPLPGGGALSLRGGF